MGPTHMGQQRVFGVTRIDAHKARQGIPLKAASQRFNRFVSSTSAIAIPAIFKRLLGGIWWSIVGVLISRGMMLLASVAVARILGVAVFGQWGVVRSTIDMFSILIGMGAGVTATKFVAELRDKDPIRAGRILSIAMVYGLAVGGGLTLVLYGASAFLAETIIDSPAMVSPLRIAAFFLLINACSGVFTGALAGLESFRGITVANFFAGLAGMPIVIGLTYSYGLAGAASGYLSFYGLTAVFLAYQMFIGLRRFKIKLQFNDIFSEVKTLYQFSLPATISGAIGGPVLWLCYAYTSNLANGFIIVGTYNAAKVVHSILIQVGVALHSPLLSMLSNTRGDGRDENIVGALNVLSSWALGAVFCLLPICLPETIILLFGSRFAGNEFASTISVTLFSTYLVLYKQGLGRIIISQNLMWWGVWENVWWSAVLWAVLPLLTIKFGALGFALAFAIAYALDIIAISPFYLRKKIIPPAFSLSGEALLISLLLATGVVLVVGNVEMMVRVVYLLMSLALVPSLFYRLYRKIMKPVLGRGA